MKKLLLLLLILGQFAQAQDTTNYLTKRKWYLPDHYKLQFAGNIGFLSGGPGYISKNKSLETDFMFGFMPAKFGGDALISVTGKMTYFPWRISLNNTSYIAPISIGFYINYTFGAQFDTKWPSYYPKGYYWWATTFRPGLYFGGKIGKEVTVRNKQRDLELYYEVGTYDLMLISYAQNTDFIKLKDILSLSIGMKFSFPKTN
jgi:hypothetical protein